MYGMSLLLSDWMHCNKNEGYRGRDYDFVLFCLALLLCFSKRANAVNHKLLRMIHSIGEEGFCKHFPVARSISVNFVCVP